MNLSTALLLLSALTLSAAGIGLGVKFLMRKNYLLGVEWIVMGVSSLNAFNYFLTDSVHSFSVAHFFDAFSRAFGIPIVVPLGMLAITHRYKPALTIDIAIFAMSFAATFVILLPGFSTALPYFLLTTWTLFTIYLFYFSFLVWRAGFARQALGVLIVAITSQIVVTTDDFYRSPGDDSLFYTIALFTWSYMAVQLYYAYKLMERTTEVKAIT